MTLRIEVVKEIREIYESILSEILVREACFKNLWLYGSEEDLFKELVFCLLTPQSKAEVCWDRVEQLNSEGLLLRGGYEEIVSVLRGVRFRRAKARYILEARDKFLVDGVLTVRQVLRSFSDVFSLRDWFVASLRGMGYKEASHFLRNISLGSEFAILDRHVLKSMLRFDIIDYLPKTLSRARYISLERSLRNFSLEVGIPISHLDFVFWYRESGRIFK